MQPASVPYLERRGAFTLACVAGRDACDSFVGGNDGEAFCLWAGLFIRVEPLVSRAS
jgi:hypothetical protein